MKSNWLSFHYNQGQYCIIFHLRPRKFPVKINHIPIPLEDMWSKVTADGIAEFVWQPTSTLLEAALNNIKNFLTA